MYGRPRVRTRRDEALAKPFPRTWNPCPGQRVWLPYSSKRLLNSPTGVILKVSEDLIKVAYLPACLGRQHCVHTTIWIPWKQARPAPQLTTFEEQLTILQEMVELKYGSGGV